MLRRAALRYLLRHPWQLALAVFGIAIGVAVVVAIDLANTSAQKAFLLSRDAVTGPATHEIVGGPDGVPESAYRRLRIELGLRASAPVIEAPVTLTGEDGANPQAMTLLGVDPLAETNLGRGLGRGRVEGEMARLIAEPGTAVLLEQRAASLGLASGDRLRLSGGGRDFQLKLVGTLDPDTELDRQGLEDVVLTDVATAQEVLGRTGYLSRIDLAADGDTAARIAEVLPAPLQVLESEARTDALEQMTRAFRLNLTALSLLALMVGAFLIYNTLTFSVIQRRPLIGGLRALGVTRGEVLRLLLLEGASLGIVGSLLGLLAGIILGDSLLHLVGRTINDLYYATDVSRLRVEAAPLAKGFALGIGASLVATAVPAYDALRTPPRGALIRSAVETRARRAAPRLALSGLALCIAAAVLLAVPSPGLLPAFTGLFLLLLGFALLAPTFTLGLLNAVRPLLRGGAGLLGAMAARSIHTSLSRTGVAVAALAIAVSATVGVGIMIDSFRGSVVHWLENTLRADVFIAPNDGGARAAIDTAWVSRLEDVAGVDYVSLGRRVDLDTAEGPVQLFALQMPRHSFAGFELKHGNAPRARQAFFEEGAVIVSEPFAYRHGIEPGDRVALPTARGRHEFAVAGVYYDYGSDQGYVTMSRDTYVQHWEDPSITSLGLYLQAGVPVGDILEPVRAMLAGSALAAQSNRELREASMAIFDRTFTITGVLRMLAVLVAFAGILSALMAIQLERARELAVLRATGLTPRQLFGLVTGETGLMGLAAGLLALPLGLFMSVVLVFIINRRSFGWSMQLQVDPGLLAQSVALAVVAALLAGLYPAWRMARTSPALALRTE